MVAQKGRYLYLNGRLMAEISGEDILMKRVRSRHLYRVLNAWCVNTEIVAICKKRFIVALPDGDRYIISISKVSQLRSKLNMFVTLGTERQLAIPLECWDYYVRNINPATEPEFPAAIGLSADEFVAAPDGRWRSRLIAHSQMEMSL